MNPHTIADTFIFVMGGIGAEKKKPYLKVSNGRQELYVTIPKRLHPSIDEDTFAGYNPDDEIDLTVRIRAGSEGLTLAEVPDVLDAIQ